MTADPTKMGTSASPGSGPRALSGSSMSGPSPSAGSGHSAGHTAGNTGSGYGRLPVSSRCRSCGFAPPGGPDDPLCPDCRGRLPADTPKAIGKYVIEGILGAGAMGTVYKAGQPELNRSVAVKVMIAGEHAGRDVIARFVREARSVAKLSHPGIVPVFDMGVEGSLHYFVMELVEGRSLRELLARGPIPVDAALRTAYFVANALHFAHTAGVVHRDIKPGNILIDASGRVRLVDFGLAKMTMGEGPDGSLATHPGTLCGTPQYMSPEQALDAGDDVDARSDIYSLGAVLYEMLTLRPPVEGRNLLAVLRKIELEDPAPPSAINPAVPAAVDAVTLRALAKDKSARFQTAAEFAAALAECLNAGSLTAPVERIDAPARPPAPPALPAAAPTPAVPTLPELPGAVLPAPPAAPSGALAPAAGTMPTMPTMPTGPLPPAAPPTPTAARWGVPTWAGVAASLLLAVGLGAVLGNLSGLVGPGGSGGGKGPSQPSDPTGPSAGISGNTTDPSAITGPGTSAPSGRDPAAAPDRGNPLLRFPPFTGIGKLPIPGGTGPGGTTPGKPEDGRGTPMDPADLARELLTAAEALNAPTPAARAERTGLLSAAWMLINRGEPGTAPPASALLTRARIARTAGDYLSARADLDRLIRQEPVNLPAREERLLTNLAIYGLLLGGVHEGCLRPRRWDTVLEDAGALLAVGDARAKVIARAAESFSKRDLPAVAAFADPPTDSGRASADLAAAGLAAVLQQIESASAEDRVRPLSDAFAADLSAALGLWPHHPGLMLVKARGALADRLLPGRAKRDAVTAALQSFRELTVARGPETDIARLVLLSLPAASGPTSAMAAADGRTGNEAAAALTEATNLVERCRDRAAGRDLLPELRTLRAWAALVAVSTVPPGGDGKTPAKPPEDAALVTLVKDDLDPLLRERRCPEEGPYLLRAVANAGLGKWREAQADLKAAVDRAGGIPATGSAAVAAWACEAAAPADAFLAATAAMLNELGRPESAARIRDVTARENRAARFSESAAVVLFDEEASVAATVRGGNIRPEVRNDGKAASGRGWMRLKPGWAVVESPEGWRFRIAENPSSPGEYRFLRYACKAAGGAAPALGLPDETGRVTRSYRFGPEPSGWNGKVVDAVPAAPNSEWGVVVRDLWADFGPGTVTALALACCGGDHVGFDHIALGRTRADVERVPASPAVLRLFEDEPSFVSLLTHGRGRHSLEPRERFAGAACLYVAGADRGRADIWNWDFPVVEKPGPGQWRFLRFAWKKGGGARIGLTLHFDPKTWPHGNARPASQCFFAGQRPPGPGGQACKRVGEPVPADWTVCTVDLFAVVGGPARLTGVTFHPYDGDFALFDSIYLARSVEELDKPVEPPPVPPPPPRPMPMPLPAPAPNPAPPPGTGTAARGNP